MKTAIVLIPVIVAGVLVGILPACASFLHLANEPAQSVVCAASRDALPVLEAQAKLCGAAAPICLAALESTYETACGMSAKAGADQAHAERAGLEAVHRAGVKMGSAVLQPSYKP